MCQKYRVGWNNPTVCFAGYYKHLDVAFTTDCSTTLNSELWFVAARKCFMELPPKPTLHSGHKFRSLEFEGTNFSSVKLKFYCHAADQLLRSEWQVEELATRILSKSTEEIPSYPSSIERLIYVSKQQKRVFSCVPHHHIYYDCL